MAVMTVMVTVVMAVVMVGAFTFAKIQSMVIFNVILGHNVTKQTMGLYFSQIKSVSWECN